jgi:hypothetical protein
MKTNWREIAESLSNWPFDDDASSNATPVRDPIVDPNVAESVSSGIGLRAEEIIEVSCSHAPGCPHSIADLITEYQRAGKLRVEYDGKAVWLVRSQEYRSAIDGSTVYTLSEWTRLAGLSAEEIRLMHSLRTIGGTGGIIDIKENV